MPNSTYVTAGINGLTLPPPNLTKPNCSSPVSFYCSLSHINTPAHNYRHKTEVHSSVVIRSQNLEILLLLRSCRLRTSSLTCSWRTCWRTSCLSVSWTMPILSNFSPFKRSNARPARNRSETSG